MGATQPQQTKDVTFGLLGRTLGHSWSPQIHARLGSTPYDLIELEPDEVKPFVREGSWRGLNVTIPYKRVAAEAADVLSDRVAALGVANTLVHLEDGRIFADNTDVLGFDAMLRSFAEERLGMDADEAFAGKKVLVLGTGGAAQAVSYVLEALHGCRVAFVSRTGDSTYENLTELHGDAALVVNTTPVGMFPHCPASPLSDEVFTHLPELRGVLDVVYNPLRTGICLQAERHGIPSESGLAMLVWQAVYASERFQGIELDHRLANQVLTELRGSIGNIALIGMPGAGKTTSGRSLAHAIRRPFIDLDDAFEIRYGMSAAECIKSLGEAAFRERETEVLAFYGARSGAVIACGGGVVTQARNYDLLHQNSTIVFIDRPLEELSDRGRPISQARGIEELARERMGLYRSWADHVLTCTGSAAGDARAIRKLLGL